MKNYPRWEWATFLPRFAVGFLVGLLVGYGVATRYVFRNDSEYDSATFYLTLFGVATACGLATWWFGDD